eukprot:TRINITY_DN5449_c0_g1_i2.p1 TRINITY_DN5449_c0_g1~~TRINITY_DN5449_c0_g1_i2.p1  ORF type:complete len:1051 (+),score=234.69 TRINITY_DN5449_c0_g1_i2:47-3154(+)
MSRRPGATSASNLSRDEILVVERFDFTHPMKVRQGGVQEGEYKVSIVENVVEFKGNTGFVVELTAETEATIDYEGDQLLLQGIGIYGDPSTKSAIRRIILTKVEQLLNQQQLNKTLQKSQQRGREDATSGWLLHDSPISSSHFNKNTVPEPKQKPQHRTSPPMVPSEPVNYNPPPIPSSIPSESVKPISVSVSATQPPVPPNGFHSVPESPIAATGGGPGNLRRSVAGGGGSTRSVSSMKADLPMRSALQQQQQQQQQQHPYQQQEQVVPVTGSVSRNGDVDVMYAPMVQRNGGHNQQQYVNSVSEYTVPNDSIQRDIPQRGTSGRQMQSQSVSPAELNAHRPMSVAVPAKRRVIAPKPPPTSCMLPTSVLPSPNMRPFGSIGPSVGTVQVVDLVQEPSSERGKLLMLVSEDASGNNLVALYNGHAEVELYVETWISPGMRPAGAVQKSIHPQYKADIFCITVQPGETVEFYVGGTGEPQPGWKTQPLTDVSYNKRKKEREARVFEDYQRLQEIASTDAPELKVLEASVSQRVPFIDLWFLPQPSSLAKKFEPSPPSEIDAWGRPSVYLPPGQHGQLFLSEPSCNDIDMGVMGSAWLPCCLSALSERNDLKLIQSIFDRHKSEYSAIGAYRLVLCRDAWWRDVVVDDYLPLVRYPKKSLTDAPAFCHNVTQPREMWAAIIEKAYARLCGSYSAISTGYFHEGISDLTGFPCEKIKWDDRKADNTLYPLLAATLTNNPDDLILLHTPNADAEYNDKESTYEKNCLALGHAYTILDHIAMSGHRLFRLRNPWPGIGKWKGRWAANSQLWDSNPDIAEAADYSHDANDGTFWVAWPEVLDWFTGGSICHILPDAGEIRLALPFKPSSPGFALEIIVDTPVKLYMSLFQKDQRNREDPVPYGCMNITHLQQSPTDGSQWQRMREDYEWGSKELLSVFDLHPDDGNNIFAIHDYDGGEKGGKITEDMVIALHYTPLERDGPTPEGTVFIKDPGPVLEGIKYNPVYIKEHLSSLESYSQVRRHIASQSQPVQHQLVSQISL